MSGRQKRRRTGKAGSHGFTLIEVAIAVLVAAMGVLAVFALLGSALGAGSRAVADTHSGFFAKDVFSGLRAHSEVAAESGSANWNDYWDDFGDGLSPMSVSSRYAWQDPNSMVIQSSQSGEVYTQVFRNASFRGSSVTNVEDHILLYRLTVGKHAPTYTPAPSWTNRTVTLEVWEGSGGISGDPIVYYSEFLDPGDM